MNTLKKILLGLSIYVLPHFALYAQETPTKDKIDMGSEIEVKARRREVNPYDKDGRNYPAGVMGTHVHDTGEWMISYSYMNMKMGPNLVGNKPISTATLLNTFQTAPTISSTSMGTMSSMSGTTLSLNPYKYSMAPERMNMQMQMIGAMAGITKNLTVMFMGSYLNNTMKMGNPNGTTFNMGASGVGDFMTKFNYRFLHIGTNQLIAHLGFTVPTGSIDEKTRTPMNLRASVPYKMQPGTGTYNLLPGITYTGELGRIYWGAQLSANLRSGQNANKYRFGNVYTASTWVGFWIMKWIDGSVRVSETKWEDVIGQDPALNPLMSPAADPRKQGGRLYMIYGGINFHFGGEKNPPYALLLEYGEPIYQHLNGPQMKINSSFMISLQYTL